MALDKQQKKAIATTYKQTFRPMGIYQIRNLDNGRIFVDCSLDLEASRNRHQFVSAMARTPIPELQEDWQTFGGKRFVFEILDQLPPREDVLADASAVSKCKEELADLRKLWIEKLQPFGAKGYNKP